MGVLTMKMLGGRVLLSSVLALSILGGRSAHAQISPGELSRAHQKLEGISGCTSCHAMGHAITADNCYSCHQELASRVKAGRGLHATFSGKACVDCHKEHHGRDFDLVRMERSSFDHRATGFVLEGRHAGLKCEQCHRAEKITAQDVLARPGLIAAGTFLGLSANCASCHTDPHKGGLGETCTSCHTNSAWSPAPGFSHARTRFALTGRHTEVRCAQCHTATVSGRPQMVYRGLRFDDCASCHRDVHSGKFTQACSSCHLTAGWGSAARAFDHTRTRFPLRGKHARVGCEGCHGSSGKSSGMTVAAHRPVTRFEHCADCHRDPHGGQFAARPGGGRCEECHTEAGWAVESIAGFNHAATEFPLRGKHASVDCSKCHVPAKMAAGQAGRLRFQHCADCHRDPHAGQFVLRSDVGACESCHREEGFVPAVFPVSAHAAGRFPLAGSHLAVPCDRCHQMETISGARTRVFRRSELPGCASCHEDAHKGVLTRWMTDGCATCHTADAWTGVAFAHDRTGFPLKGAHKEVACRACHTKGTDGLARYAGIPKVCSACHDSAQPSSRKGMS